MKIKMRILAISLFVTIAVIAWMTLDRRDKPELPQTPRFSWCHIYTTQGNCAIPRESAMWVEAVWREVANLDLRLLKTKRRGLPDSIIEFYDLIDGNPVRVGFLGWWPDLKTDVIAVSFGEHEWSGIVSNTRKSELQDKCVSAVNNIEQLKESLSIRDSGSQCLNLASLHRLLSPTSFSELLVEYKDRLDARSLDFGERITRKSE